MFQRLARLSQLTLASNRNLSDRSLSRASINCLFTLQSGCFKLLSSCLALASHPSVWYVLCPLLSSFRLIKGNRLRHRSRRPSYQLHIAAVICVSILVRLTLWAQEQTTAPQPEILAATPSWRRIPGSKSLSAGSLQGEVKDIRGIPVPGVTVTIIRSGEAPRAGVSDAEGIFRFLSVPPGSYDVRIEKEGCRPQSYSNLELHAGELIAMELRLELANPSATTEKGPSGIPGAKQGPTEEAEAGANGSYPGLRRPAAQPMSETSNAVPLPSDRQVFSPDTDRWNVEVPGWNRYGRGGEYPYTRSHWYDPFNRNLLKGDKPIFGERWFLNFTGQSVTNFDVRRLPVPSGVSAEQPGNQEFFGRGEQAFLSQNFRFTFDLFRGDAAFRPVDWRFRITPEVNLNFLQTRERGLVNIDVRKGIDRFDTHTGVQEAFVEAKLRDLSPNFDFVSARAGIQQFTSDFRGFIFSEEQPGIRLFGDLRSNRINYNLAYFFFLEKNTNSGLNTLNSRHQQVYVANVYIQDSLFKGYTTEFSFHYNRDDPTIHYDDNGFLVRPAPIGSVVNGRVLTHGIRAYYLGWASNGHIHRLNVSHAFYQALGHDDFNPIAGRRVDIDARMAAVELSVDKDWTRLRTSFFYSSGDSNPYVGMFRRDTTAHGFDTIVDDTHFAGGAFSFFDAQGIRLTSTGVALVSPGSLLPSLRSNKEEGQANFVNPGLYLFNVGADFNVTPKLRAFVNANYLRFDRTEPLQILLFQGNIRHSIGEDFGIGAEYRPPLTENIVVTAGASTLVPGQGLEDIYNKRVLLSVFSSIRFLF